MKEETDANEIEPEGSISTKAPKQKSPNGFTVSDAQQKAGEHGYDNDGPFGIGMIKGK